MPAQPRCSVSQWPRATASPSSAWTPLMSCSSQGLKVGTRAAMGLLAICSPPKVRKEAPPNLMPCLCLLIS